MTTAGYVVFIVKFALYFILGIAVFALTVVVVVAPFVAVFAFISECADASDRKRWVRESRTPISLHSRWPR